MVVPVPVNDMIIVEKWPFFFGEVPAGNPLPVGVGGCGWASGSRDSGVSVCYDTIPKYVLGIIRR